MTHSAPPLELNEPVIQAVATGLLHPVEVAGGKQHDACDLCSWPGTSAMLKVEAFTTPWNSFASDIWFICAQCEDLIRADKWAEVSTRAAKRTLLRFGEVRLDVIVAIHHGVRDNMRSRLRRNGMLP